VTGDCHAGIRGSRGLRCSRPPDCRTSPGERGRRWAARRRVPLRVPGRHVRSSAAAEVCRGVRALVCRAGRRSRAMSSASAVLLAAQAFAAGENSRTQPSQPRRPHRRQPSVDRRARGRASSAARRPGVASRRGGSRLHGEALHPLAVRNQLDLLKTLVGVLVEDHVAASRFGARACAAESPKRSRRRRAASRLRAASGASSASGFRFGGCARV
jgi:hypothetical protein